MQEYRPEDAIYQWNKDDYLKSSAPYEWLYALKDSAFAMTRMKTLMEEAAIKVGVKNFKALWKAYLETQVNKGGKSLLVNVTEFSGQPMELKCGEYVCSDFGVTVAGMYGNVVTVCPHPVMPVRRMVNIDTGEVKLEIAFKRQTWRHVIFSKDVLSNAKNITALSRCGISVTSDSAGALVKFLAYLEDANYEDLPETKTVGRLGWVSDYGFSPYVEGLEYDDNGMYSDAFKAVRAKGSYDEWLTLARGVRAGQSIPCRIALAASFASVLVKKVDALPFFIHLWGAESGLGKSVALCLAGSVWAYPEIGQGFVQSLNSTDVAFEQFAAFCGNLPLCMDELQQIQARKDYDSVIYMLCEGAGKNRGSKTGGLRAAQHWRNVIITTGEQPITTATSKAGAVNRVIEVECKEALFPNAREAIQVLVRNYGYAGKRFVKGLCDNRDAMDVLMNAQQIFYEQMTGKATDKQVLSASLLLAADALSDLLIFNDGNSLTVGDVLPYLVTKAQVDTNRRAYEWLLDLIASNPSRFIPDAYGTYTGECWGCIEQDRAWVIKSVFDRQMTAQGFNPTSFLSWARSAGMIEYSQSEKRTTKRKRIREGGTGVNVPVWCVCLCLPSEEGTRLSSGDTLIEDAEVETQLKI